MLSITSAPPGSACAYRAEKRSARAPGTSRAPTWLSSSGPAAVGSRTTPPRLRAPRTAGAVLAAEVNPPPSIGTIDVSIGAHSPGAFSYQPLDVVNDVVAVPAACVTVCDHGVNDSPAPRA